MRKDINVRIHAYKSEEGNGGESRVDGFSGEAIKKLLRETHCVDKFASHSFGASRARIPGEDNFDGALIGVSLDVIDSERVTLIRVALD